MPQAARPAGSWPYPNGDLANTRDAAGSAITSANVSQLEQAWSFHLAGSAVAGGTTFGSMSAGPIVVNGVVYIQDLDDNVYALSLATGKLQWEYRVDVSEKAGRARRRRGGGRRGLRRHLGHGLRAQRPHRQGRLGRQSTCSHSGQGTFDIQPQVAGGRVYVASAYGSGPGGGVLFALNAVERPARLAVSTRSLAPSRRAGRAGSAPAAPGRRRWSAATAR